MITAKTESGFSIELEESTLDNMEVLDALSDLDEGNPLAMSRLVVKLLGKDGKKRELHIDKALDVANLHSSAEPKQPLRVLKYRQGVAS